jgi:hypothetical protein
MPNPRELLTSQNASLWCVLLGLLLLGGILSGHGGEVRTSGNSRAGEVLYRDTAHRLAARARSASLCDQVSAIHTEILHEPLPGGQGHGTVVQPYRHGSVEERWTVSLCQRQLPYRVTFTADAGGSIYASIGAE